MQKPTTTQKSPYPTVLEEGKTYFWCSCGRSDKQPFCDGSHKDTAFKPIKFIAKENGTTYLCGCKHTCDQPFCDGTHSTIKE